MGYKYQIMYISFSLKIVFVLRNSADPDEMPISEKLHLGLSLFAEVPV